jgi:hypothetical protein
LVRVRVVFHDLDVPQSFERRGAEMLQEEQLEVAMRDKGNSFVRNADAVATPTHGKPLEIAA